MSRDSISIDSAASAGNSTIFEGNTLSTGSRADSQVRMKNGAEVRLGTDSAGKLFSDHVDLQRGTAQISSYSANANGLSVHADAPSSAQVSIHGKTVEIAALTGKVQVFNAAGINVANLVPGKALSMFPQDAGASAPSSLVGCAVKNKTNILLTDETSSVVVQLRGGKVRTDRRIQVTGAMVPNAAPPSPATQVIEVASVKEIGGACNAAAVAMAGGTMAGPPASGGAIPAATGIGATAAGIGLKTIIVADVVIAAGVGTAVAVATGSIFSSTTTSPATHQ